MQYRQAPSAGPTRTIYAKRAHKAHLDLDAQRARGGSPSRSVNSEPNGERAVRRIEPRQLLGHRGCLHSAHRSEADRMASPVRLFVNSFQLSFKIANKTRDGARVTKRYHKPIGMISTRPFIVLATSRMTMNSTSRTARPHARRPCRPCRRDTRSNPTPAGAVGQAMANGHQIATAGRIATNENVTRSFRSSLSTPTVCPADPVKSSGYAIKVIVVTIDAHANKVFAHEHRE